MDYNEFLHTKVREAPACGFTKPKADMRFRKKLYQRGREIAEKKSRERRDERKKATTGSLEDEH